VGESTASSARLGNPQRIFFEMTHLKLLQVEHFRYHLLPNNLNHKGNHMETTLIILKPDAVQRNLMGRILTRFEDKGLQIVGCKLMRISQELAAEHYKDHASKPFYPGLVRFMTGNPVLTMAVRGIGAITICRSMMGATFGSKAAAGTIRGDFGVSNSYNLIHGSDSPEAATRELGLFFKAGDILEYSRAGDSYVYDSTGSKPE
jgi:nucleoside-diphosphate kinase